MWKASEVGGTAIYIRNCIFFKALDTTSVLPSEMEATAVDIPHLNLFLVCLYIPPQLSADTHKKVQEGLVKIVDEHTTEYPSRDIMILGDFNDFEVKKLDEELDLTNIVTVPTRGANILDHILISEGLKPHYDSTTLRYESPIGKSDHLTLILSPKQQNQKYSYIDMRECTVFDYRASNISTLLQTARNVNWEAMIDEKDDVNQQWNAFHYHMVSLIEASIPRKIVIMTNNDKHWMTPVTKMLIDEKWEAFRAKDWQRYNHLRTKVKVEIKKAKSLWTTKLNRSPNGLWKTTKQLSGKKVKCELEGLVSENQPPQALADTIAGSIGVRQYTPGSAFSNENDTDDWPVRITVEEVFEHLANLPQNKAPGWEGIPNKIYTLLSPFIAIPLTVIYNSSISQRKFPDAWKEGVVVPVPKTRPPVINKLRMITLLPTPSKILEKIILKKMSPTIDPLFGPSQHAYRKELSTLTALLQTFDKLTRISVLR